MASMNPRRKRSRDCLPPKIGRCRWCGGEAKPPRQTWCSDKCVQEYLAEEPAALRAAVEKRDREVCAECGRDCTALREKINAHLHPQPMTGDARMRSLRFASLLKRLKLISPRYIAKLRHLWEADHIVPVVEGGPNTLENLRTLCLPCHKAATRTLAARRAAARRVPKAVA